MSSRIFSPRLLLFLLIGAITCQAPIQANSSADNQKVSFRRQVAPLLVGRCLGCHNDEKADSGLNLKTFSLLRKGGVSLGTGILEPGDPEGSHLISVLKADAVPRMPLQQAPLKESEIEILERWVREGAEFDGPSQAETLLSSLVDPLANLPPVGRKKHVLPPATALAVSSDAKLLAVARGREILLLDSSSGTIAATLAGLDGSVQAMQFTPDGQTLIAVGGRPGQFGEVGVWDIPTQTKLRKFRGHADAILALAISPDGQTLATSSYDRLVKLWDANTGTEIRTLKEHTDAVYGVCFSPDGRSVASVAGDRTLKLWDVATGQKTLSLADATGELYSVVFASDGKSIVAAGVDRLIRSWTLDGQTATLGQTVFAHEGAVTRLVLLPTVGLLASIGEDKLVKLWDLKTLSSQRTSEPQPAAPLSLASSVDGRVLATGLYDGTVVRLNEVLEVQSRWMGPESVQDGGVAGSATAMPQEPKKPELVRNANLGPPSPRSGVRGGTHTLKLSGQGSGQATSIIFSDPGITANLKPREPAEPNGIDAIVTIAPSVRPGLYRFWIRTPQGTPPSQSFLVSVDPEVAEQEPGDSLEAPTRVSLPSTLLGTIEKPGDVDRFEFPATQGENLVFELVAKKLGSSLNGTLEVSDEAGTRLATAGRTEDGREAVLVYRVEQPGLIRLSVRDLDSGGSAGHFYQIWSGANPLLRSVWPLAFEIPGRSAENKVELAAAGENLPSGKLTAEIRSGTGPGTVIQVPSGPQADLDASALERWSVTGTRQILATEGPVVTESRPSPTSEQAVPISAPGTFVGRIETPGDLDHISFEAKCGERWVVEVYGRRLGSAIDPSIEILDAGGQPVPCAVLKRVRETTVAFRDHNSRGKSIRLTWPWTGFEAGDHVWIGNELLRIQELPRNPDDDAVFWGTGGVRFNQGERLAFLGTTTEQHAMGQVISKVEVHPPGTTFPAGGQRPITLFYRNDDGGAGAGKDSRLVFQAPADGVYVVRVQDLCGQSGPDVTYSLTVRKLRPDFRVSLASGTPNIPKGAATFVPVNVERIDGFRGPVEVRVEGLPPGVRAVPTVIEQDQYTADLLFVSEETELEPTGNDSWQLVGRGVSDPVQAKDLNAPTDDEPWIRENRWTSEGPANWVTVISEPNVAVSAATDGVRIQPGQEITLSLSIERRNGFSGRVPIDIRNLPYGVSVQNIGLNGVLVIEQATERTITLYAEPWVKPQSRSFFAVARCEAAGTEAASRPIVLEVAPIGQNAP